MKIGYLWILLDKIDYFFINFWVHEKYELVRLRIPIYILLLPIKVLFLPLIPVAMIFPPTGPDITFVK
jgi:hypothetical protein